ncbi:MFS transporter [Altererythrobacter lutimaris]|uniref:MFS transporter n=1 Tax=Altererythrobacter lutimaris TaxID=2743979 RepID=UPI001E42D3E9|nr:MFS transporter [Altererythrobacter lutimaris]
MASAPANPAHQATATASLPSSGRAWFAVFALSIAGIVSYIDRQILNLLVDPIKADLALSDVQISLLQGFSFALFYAVMAIPLAWMADRHNRKWVILAGLVCWSSATFMSGFAAGFLFLFFARMLVGVGEATLSPAGFSIISDNFSKERLPAALGVFTGSGFIGSGLALTVGGILYAQLAAIGPVTLPFGTFAPWQLTFMAVALLSVPLFFLLLLVREPERQPDNIVMASDDAPPAFEIAQFLKRHAAVFIPLFFGFSSFAAAQYGIGAWAPSFFGRTFDWSELQIGQYLGPVTMVAGVTGVVAGGFLAGKLMSSGIKDATLKLSMIAVACALPFAIVFPLVESPFAALGLLGLVLLLGTVPFGAGVSTFPLITPNRMRAQVIAVYLLIANLVGYSAGPIFIAALTDNYFADPASLNQSMAIAAPTMMVCGIILIAFAVKPYKAMLAAQSSQES